VRWDLLRLDCVLRYVPGPVLYVWKEGGAQDVVFTLLIPRPAEQETFIAAAGAHPVLSWLRWSAFMLIQRRIYGFMDTNHIIADIETETAIFST
jgi:hypothetical protein